ncbi:uncharacterized protein LOC107645407 isoform X1 [Arachis ipaensis]|uniref:uncharacterized protein LOC107645407 isoform X1 n=1 Tax=Arachis ipaensis TaxID=130454 RepID=UPI0007AFD51F|nr:uncharacterized protein LOC107645407 isoform X1 [Arachis ipaensis]XP_025662909.1 uncharacterized protein LOC112758447 isoform X1 [Arachis hypogaea]
MRIRKSHAFLSSPHFPPTPPSDPHRSPGLVQLTTANLHHRQRGSDHGAQPSDQPINGWDDSSGESGAHRQHIKQDPSVEDDYDYDDGRREDSGEDSEDKKSNHSRKGNIFGSSQTLPPAPPLNLYSSTPLQVLYADERWCEEEKAIPFKKRRGSFDNMGMSDGKKTKARMKTKMNNKCSNNNKSEEEKVKGKKKKKGRGSAVMEGSRCSRVNGRGWRCCQQTLVGYSLCEHHLGKGRLRSMTSVRNRSTTTKVVVQQQQQHAHDRGNNNNNPSSSSSSDKLSVKTIMGGGSSNKRKMKQLGMVKARSINSLLGQTTNTPIAHT